MDGAPDAWPSGGLISNFTILEFEIWNVVYEGILKHPMPPGVRLVAYADDVVVVITARDTRLAGQKLDRAIGHVTGWLRNRGLQLAIQKTELLFLTRKRIDTRIDMAVGTTQMATRGEANYLGVTLDTKLSFWPHIRRVTKKAAAKTAALTRLMANTTGPRPSTRRLLMTVTHSILLYGAEIWGYATRVKKYRKAMMAVQRRGALRIACAYRTVSEPAILVIAGIVPVDLLALERKRIYELALELGRDEAAKTARTETMTSWQATWAGQQQARWTRRLITDVRLWKERKFGEVDFYLTQFLSGHGYFRQYLCRAGKVTTPNCKFCGDERDDVEHTFYACPRWAADRERLETDAGSPLTPDNTTTLMLKDRRTWDLIARHVSRTLKAKKAEGCLED